MLNRIALIGPGAIGGCIAAQLLAAAKCDLSIAARTPFETLAVEQPDGSVLESRPVFIDSSDAPELPFDWLLVATKAYDAAGTAAWLDALVSPTTRVAILQNGVEHRERFREHVPAERLLPVMIDLPAERTAPGRIRQRGKGVLRVPDDPLGREFVALLAGTTLDVATSADFVSVLWRKLAVNTPGAVNALLLQPNRIAHDPAIADLMRGIILETIAVGRAEGARLDDSLAEKILASQCAAAPDGVNSILGDRLAGRTMESDARNGAVVRAGLRHNIPTPLNTMAFTLLEAQQPRRDP
ncbi:MAG TPA: 2-dehydropantoate 2-reductase [Opitutaceae bacterium]|nr:2-dehydropantoate 2-reductase [Opitutaceae bacterium]